MDDPAFPNEEAPGAISREDAATLLPVATLLGTGVVVILAQAAVQTFEMSNFGTLIMVARMQAAAVRKLISTTELFRGAPLLLDDIEPRFCSTPDVGVEKQMNLTEPLVMKFVMQFYTSVANNFLSPLLQEKFESESQAVMKSPKTGREGDPKFIRSTVHEIERFLNTNCNGNAMNKRDAQEENREGWDAVLQKNFRALMKAPIIEAFSDSFSAERWLRAREKGLNASQLAFLAKIMASARNADSNEHKAIFQSFVGTIQKFWEECTPSLRSEMAKLRGLRAYIEKERGNQSQIMAVRSSNTKVHCN